MDDKREFDYLHLRITRLEEQGTAARTEDQAWRLRMEEKIDRLMSFRGWVLGGVAALSTAISLIWAWVTQGRG